MLLARSGGDALILLPPILPIHIQRMLVAGDVADHRVATDAGEDRCGGAQGEMAELAVLDMKDERGGRLAFGITGRSNAPELGQLAQALPELLIFRQVGERASIVLEIADQAAGQALPAVEVALAVRAKDQFQQMDALMAGGDERSLLLGLKELERGVVPGVKIPEPVQRMGRVGGIQHQQLRQVAEIQQHACIERVVDLLASQPGKGGIELAALGALELQRACNAMHHMGRGIAAHPRLQVVNICARKPCRLGKLALREAALLTQLRHKLGKISTANTLFFLSYLKNLLATNSIMPENLLAGNVSFPSGPLYDYRRRGVNPYFDSAPSQENGSPDRQGGKLSWLREELLRNVRSI